MDSREYARACSVEIPGRLTTGLDTRSGWRVTAPAENMRRARAYFARRRHLTGGRSDSSRPVPRVHHVQIRHVRPHVTMSEQLLDGAYPFSRSARGEAVPHRVRTDALRQTRSPGRPRN